MEIGGLIRTVIAQFLTLAEGILENWVNVTANASGPLDPNITLTSSGNALAESIATVAVRAADIMYTIFEALI